MAKIVGIDFHRALRDLVHHLFPGKKDGLVGKKNGLKKVVCVIYKNVRPVGKSA